MPQRISVIASRPLGAVIAGMRTLDRDNRREIRTQTKNILAGVWRTAVAAEASTDVERRVIVPTARVAVSDRNVTLRAASSTRALSGGLIPREGARIVEFGGNRNATSTYRARSPRGTPFQVTRHTQRQLTPYRRQGYVFYPALEKVIPRLAALWAQTWARGIHEAWEARGGR